MRLDPDFSGCTTRTATVTSSASPKIEFYDLFVDVDNISCNEDILNITSGDTLIVANDFTHQDGYINTGVVRVKGDIYLNNAERMEGQRRSISMMLQLIRNTIIQPPQDLHI